MPQLTVVHAAGQRAAGRGGRKWMEEVGGDGEAAERTGHLQRYVELLGFRV